MECFEGSIAKPIKITCHLKQKHGTLIISCEMAHLGISDDIPTGIIVGIVTPVLLIIVVMIFVVLWQKRKSSKKDSSQGMNSQTCY